MATEEKELKFVSKSGVELFVYRNPALHSFHLSLYLRAGSMFEENEDEYGISHFFEHIAIRNVNFKRGGALYSELDRRGVEFNATTYSELVQFFVGGAPKNFDFAAGVLLDVLSPITLTKKEVDEERSRIKAEIRESDERTSLSTFTQEIVHGGTSLAHSIAGVPRSLNKITAKRLDEFRKSAFVKGNFFFYLTGNLTDKNIEDLLSLIDTLEVPEGKINANLAPVSRNFQKRETNVYIKNADYTRVRFSFDIDMTAIKLCEGDLIYDALLSGYNSEFFIELSEKRGMLYDVSGSFERYLNMGTLSFSFEVKESELYEAVGVIVGVLSKMKKSPLPEEKCMRAAYVDNAYMLLDDPRELNFTFAYDNRIMGAGYSSIEDRRRAYLGVTPERLMEVARAIFNLNALTFTMKGRKQRIDTQKILEILKEIDG